MDEIVEGLPLRAFRTERTSASVVASEPLFL